MAEGVGLDLDAAAALGQRLRRSVAQNYSATAVARKWLAVVEGAPPPGPARDQELDPIQRLPSTFGRDA